MQTRALKIESAQNEKLKTALKLLSSNHALKSSGLAAAEGLHLAKALFSDQGWGEIDSVWLPESLLNNPEWLDLQSRSNFPVFVLPEVLFCRLSRLNTPTGPLIFFRPHAFNTQANLKKDVLVLDGVQDPGNVGTILRNCAAVGIEQVAVGDGTAWVWSDKALRAGMGAHSHIHFFKAQTVFESVVQHLASNVKCNLPIRVTSLQNNSIDLYAANLQTPGIWVFGSEGQGVGSDWLDLAEKPLKIPQKMAIESLNVAVSSAVCLFEQLRQRRS